MTVQALLLGLHVRQFRAFDREGIAAEFGVPAHWEVTTMAAIGRASGAPAPPAATGLMRSGRERRRDPRWQE